MPVIKWTLSALHLSWVKYRYENLRKIADWIGQLEIIYRKNVNKNMAFSKPIGYRAK